MVEVRSMENKDLLAYKRLCSVCYTYSVDNEVPAELPEEKLRIRRGVFGENGELLSAMMQIPYEIRFCGETASMVGIGGVVTDPVARKGGAIRAIFEQDLPAKYEEGYVFSALYPFSYRFYGKFGYIWTKFGREYRVPRESLRTDLRRADEIVRVLPGENDQGMADVYAQYVADKNFAVLRTEEMWNERRKGTPWENLKHAYVLRIGGKPAAYWIGKHERGEDGATLYMQDLAWTCQAGLEAVFAMIRGMNEISTIKVTARSGFEPALLCDEQWDVTIAGESQGMVRVVNAARALAMLPAPVTPGAVTIEVTDGQIPANCGRFTVAGDGEVLTVFRDDKTAPDIRCNIQGLSALVVGRHTFADAAALGIVDLANPRKADFAEILFTKRDLHLNWGF
nr:GNAT family N-acetyltransferase [Clostridia bacterium]